MRPQLKKTAKLGSLVVLPLFIWQSPQAQEASGGGGALVLPFKIEASIKASIKASLADTKKFLSSDRDSALDLQRASHFLIEQHYEYPLVPISETQTILDELRFRSHSILSSKRALQICRRGDAELFDHR